MCPRSTLGWRPSRRGQLAWACRLWRPVRSRRLHPGDRRRSAPQALSPSGGTSSPFWVTLCAASSASRARCSSSCWARHGRSRRRARWSGRHRRRARQPARRPGRCICRSSRCRRSTWLPGRPGGRWGMSLGLGRGSCACGGGPDCAPHPGVVQKMPMSTPTAQGPSLDHSPRSGTFPRRVPSHRTLTTCAQQN